MRYLNAEYGSASVGRQACARSIDLTLKGALRVFVSALAAATLGAGCSASLPPAGAQTVQGSVLAQTMPAWHLGNLDIHHIQTGRGNATFLVFPDGTTMLVDAGALPDSWDQDESYRPLKLAPAVPDNLRRPGQWIADYIGQFGSPQMTGLDYALISHFHPDHFGSLEANSPRSAFGDWKLTGLTDVAERWPITTMIDRDYPNYSFPVSQLDTSEPNLANYLKFVQTNVAGGKMAAESLRVGREDQITCRRNSRICSEFSVRNIAANGLVWTGEGTGTRAFLSQSEITDAKGKFNENPLSTVIKVSYGDFDYVTGGDLTGVNEPDQPEWFAMEAKVAPAVGEVDAMTLNHHGNRDATSADWLRALTPRVLIQQTWVSDHPGGEVVARMTSRKIWPDERDIFATYVHPETQVAIGPWLTKNYKSTRGHVVIRVQPGGASYMVYVLDDRDPKRRALASFGPYTARH